MYSKACISLNKVSELDSLKLGDRQTAVVLLSQLFHDPKYLAQAIRENVVAILVSFLKFEDLTCRQKASECLEIISRHGIGRSVILESGVLEHLSHLVFLITSSRTRTSSLGCT
jgi:hypothetical protein